MDLRTLRAFVEVVRQGGFSQAAKVVNATQSTVSKAVKQLEDEIGLVLLDRTGGHRQMVTAAGQIVLRRAAAMLAQRDDLVAELDELRGLKRGSLRIGFPPIGSDVVFAPIFIKYRQLYPGIEIQLVEHGSMRLEEMVSAGELDLGGSLLPVADQFQAQSLRCEPIDALIAMDHPLAHRDRLDLEELASTPFILFEAGFALNPLILDACRSRGFTPTVTARSSQINLIIELAAAGVGVGFMPRMIARQRAHPKVKIIAIAAPSMVWHMALIWRRGGYLPHAAKAWLDLAATGIVNDGSSG